MSIAGSSSNASLNTRALTSTSASMEASISGDSYYMSVKLFSNRNFQHIYACCFYKSSL